MLLHRFYYKLFKKVRFLKGSIVSKNTILEGHNSIGVNTVLCNCEIGHGTYTGSNTELTGVIIGRFCSIASNIRNVRGRHPLEKFVSTHPCFFSKGKPAGFTYSDKDKFQGVEYIDNSKKISNEIGNDVWIGDNVLIMDGVKVGDGAVIGAGALVTKDVPPYSINVGVPAKTIKFRFSEKKINQLLALEWWNKDIEWIKSNINLFDDVDALIKELELDENEEA